MKMNYVLVDYENDPVKSLALLKGEQFKVTLFLGPHNTKLPVELVLAMQELGDRAKYVVLETPGKNALDFHVAFYLGGLVRDDPNGFFHIISKDTGFDPLLKHLKVHNVLSARSVSIEEMPCFKRPAQEVAPNKKPSSQVNSEPAKSVSVEDMVKLAVTDLINRKASKPRTLKTLRSTVQATIQGRFGKNIPVSDFDSVYQNLISQGYIQVNGEKVSYTLPSV